MPELGWWIRINTNKTEASQITFQIGTEENNREFFRNWNSGESREFAVPEKYYHVKELYIHATVSPADKNAWFCVMYGRNGVKHFDFDNSEDHQMKQTDQEGECPPYDTI